MRLSVLREWFGANSKEGCLAWSKKTDEGVELGVGDRCGLQSTLLVLGCRYECCLRRAEHSQNEVLNVDVLVDQSLEFGDREIEDLHFTS